MILQALVACVKEVERWHDSQVAVNLGHSGLCSQNGLDFFKVTSRHARKNEKRV